MNSKNLIHKNIIYFTRYYKLVALAAMITVAVIVGSLVVGDSVRTTLTARVNERLGNTETIIFSRNAYMADKLTQSFGDSAKGILLTNGFISQNGKLIPVSVWGTNELSISGGAARINKALAKELGNNDLRDIVLRLPAAGLVPSGSLFVTENYTTNLRLTNDGIVDAGDGGNISMKNEQVIPFNIFVNRNHLAETLQTEGKINLILTEKIIGNDDLDKVWDYTTSGLNVNHTEEFTEITSDRVFLQQDVTHNICSKNLRSNRLFSYLANAITLNEKSVPYSFVTAIDRYDGEELKHDEVILSDYTAGRLNAKPGETIEISYFTSKQLKTLDTKTKKLRVKKIIPLAQLLADKTLSADFPGLSDVKRCTDWDSDLPIDMDLITDEDEKYWELYRSAPKAIIAYEAIESDWSNAYGNATAVRVAGKTPDLSELKAGMFGIQVIHPREAGINAAKSGVDFSGLFLALGFFIILAAILLLLVPLSEMIYRRQNELSLMKDLGFSKKRVINLLWKEAAPVVLMSSLVGVFAGLCYTIVIMWLLGNVWKGATHTDGFTVSPDIITIVSGFIVGVGLSLILLRRVIVSNISKEKQKHNTVKGSLRKRKIIIITASVMSVALIGINLLFFKTVILFVIVGIILIITAALWGDYLIYRRGSLPSEPFGSEKLIWATIFSYRKQALLSFFALTTGVFIVFSVGLNRKGFADSSRIKTGTGGYSLWGESSVPVYHNMATRDGREKLSLWDLPDNARIMQILRFGADDASCLNLNKVSTPTVLGVDMNELLVSDFGIEQNIYEIERDSLFKRIQSKTDTVYPALVDATVLTWGLMMKLGDTLRYENDNGQSIAVQLVGTLSNSIFQGNILIDRIHFNEIWEETTGSEVFLLKVDENDKDNVKTLLSQALNEYGIKVTTTNERLSQFNTVTDTYLTIFMTLGGLGLLLGIMSFIIVIRKNLSMRGSEIKLYRTLGFTDNGIKQILTRENLIVPLYAIATGIISALVSVGINFSNTGIWIWLLAVCFTILFLVCTIIFVGKTVKNELKRSNI